MTHRQKFKGQRQHILY